MCSTKKKKNGPLYLSSPPLKIKNENNHVNSKYQFIKKKTRYDY